MIQSKMKRLQVKTPMGWVTIMQDSAAPIYEALWSYQSDAFLSSIESPPVAAQGGTKFQAIVGGGTGRSAPFLRLIRNNPKFWRVVPCAPPLPGLGKKFAPDVYAGPTEVPIRLFTNPELCMSGVA